MSGDAEQEFFADGITEDIITELSRFRELFVISRNSSFKFKGRAVEVQKFAAELGVQYVVEGSVRKVGQRVRITVQLIDAKTDHHLWAERYDRDLEDIFAIQDEVTRSIVATLPGRVEAAARDRAARLTTDNMAAYECVLTGKVLPPPQQARRQRPGAAPARAGDRSIRLAPPHAWKACVLGQAWVYNWCESRPDAEVRIRAALDIALALDDNDSDVHRILAAINLIQEHYDLAAYHQRRALSLNPNDDLVVVQQGEMLTWLGQPDEGIEWIKKAMRLNTYDPERFWNHWHGPASPPGATTRRSRRCAASPRPTRCIAPPWPRAMRSATMPSPRPSSAVSPWRCSRASASASTWRACTTAIRATASITARRSSARAFRPDPPGPARPGDNRRIGQRGPRAAPSPFSLVGRPRPGHSHGSVRLIEAIARLRRPPLTSFVEGHVAMAQYVFTMNRVGKIVPPKRQIRKNISLSFFPGAKIGVLGLNGSGKSTLLKIMAGIDHDIEGEATPMPGLRIGYLPQEPQLDPDQTVRQAVEEGIGGSLAAKKRLEEVYAAYGEEGADFDELAAEQAELEAQIAAAGGENTDLQLEIAADALRLAPWDAVIGKLSGGEKRRVALCRMLLSKPDMLLLDEPTNHLDAESVDWLEQFLQRFPGTVVAITHDRYFLDNAAEWILELDRGSGIPYKGNYSLWLEQKETRLEQEQKTEDARTKAMKKELEWVRQNPKGRQAKSKARIARFEELSDIEYQKRNETNEIFIPVADRLGHEVIEFQNVSKSFGDRLLIDDLSFKVPAGAIVGIIGPNGAGKSTLFRMIAGKEKPDSGTVKVGVTAKMAFVDQSRDDLVADKTVWQDVSGGLDNLVVGKFTMPSRAYLGRFNFKGNDQQKLVGNLSGGERGRLHLAKTLIAGGNVLMLDEPSNDLDVETLRALEDALLEFAGSVMVISHDRWFLDRIATHILACEGESKWVFFDGNYQEYEADKKKRLGEEGARPKRVRFKALK